nr:hypothetical protein [Tanacetum cinerariifolium]
SRVESCETLVLDISGQNYLSWVLDTEIYLAANGLGDTIQAGKETTVEQKAKEMIFLRHHLHENLKYEYLTVKDPVQMWQHIIKVEVVVMDQTMDEDAAVDVVMVVATSVDLTEFGTDSLGVDNLGIPEDPNDITHLDVGDFLANEMNGIPTDLESGWLRYSGKACGCSSD